MLTFPVPDPINGDALRSEFRAAGLVDADPYIVGDSLVVSGTDDYGAAEQVVQAHTGQPLPLPPEQQADEDAGQQLAAVRAKARQVAAGEGTFTAAQVQKILAHLVLRSTR